MDYEKEYKEALERAKRLRDSFYQTMNAKRVAEEIFPVLAESEDERIRKWIYNMVENLGYPADEAAEKELEEMQPLALAYLDKQKPAEWSEEDEKMLNNVIEHLKVAYCACSWLSETLIWLKSLRPPQYCENCRLKKSVQGWKPSEEQMEALNYFIKLWGNSDDQLEYTKIFNTVKSLRDDLEKLM